VDYLAIASRALIGDPKFPTISVYTLNEENQYTLQQFRDQENIISLTFAELQITPAQIFQA
jgi:Uma2 family endonuclease